MGERAKEVLGADKLDVLADKGYWKVTDLIDCENAGLKAFVAQQKNSRNTDYPEFQSDNFRYDSDKDLYICPMGQELFPGRNRKVNDVEYRDYKNNRACKECEAKDRCTKAAKGRTISRSAGKELLEDINKRTSENKLLYRRRQMMVEHPFGTIKRQWGYTYFLTRGLKSVRTEASLIFMAYNFKRVLNILGVEGIVKKLSPA